MITHPVQMEIENHGAIGSMLLPPEWFAGEWKRGPFACESDRKFFSATHPEATLSMYYRGLPVSEDSGAVFTQLLAKGNRIWLRSELAKVEEIANWQTKPENFKMSISRSETIDSRQVLIIEGH